ncbi:MAG: Nif11 family protein [Verrucomicrobiota bacterium]|jgi:Nif11 domain
MSEEQAKKFIEQLEKDVDLKERLTTFISDEGFSCTLGEIRKVEWNLMMSHYTAGLPASEHWER